MENQITILIPCFNQPKFASECLKSIKNQTVKNFNVILVDDRSQEENYKEYIKLVKSYSNEISIDIIQNKSNKGAYSNMVDCILIETATKYKMVFHEDDILHPMFIEKNLEVFEEDCEIGFVVTESDFFSNSERPEYNFEIGTLNYKLIRDYKALVDLYLNDYPFSFGSVVYNNKYLKESFFEIDKYSVVSDRPFLLGLAKSNGCAVIFNKLTLNNNHEGEIIRWKNLRPIHIKNLYQLLYENKTERLTNADLKKIKYLITKNILGGRELLSDTIRPGIIPYLFYFSNKDFMHLKLFLEIKLKLLLTNYMKKKNICSRLIRVRL